jgi:hypothetical protein
LITKRLSFRENNLQPISPKNKCQMTLIKTVPTFPRSLSFLQ